MSGEERRKEVSADLRSQVANAAPCPVTEANKDMLIDIEGPNGDGTPGKPVTPAAQGWDF